MRVILFEDNSGVGVVEYWSIGGVVGDYGLWVEAR